MAPRRLAGTGVRAAAGQGWHPSVAVFPAVLRVPGRHT